MHTLKISILKNVYNDKQKSSAHRLTLFPLPFHVTFQRRMRAHRMAHVHRVLCVSFKDVQKRACAHTALCFCSLVSLCLSTSLF